MIHFGSPDAASPSIESDDHQNPGLETPVLEAALTSSHRAVTREFLEQVFGEPADHQPVPGVSGGSLLDVPVMDSPRSRDVANDMDSTFKTFAGALLGIGRDASSGTGEKVSGKSSDGPPIVQVYRCLSVNAV